jgi:putative ABC transport system permease protein
MTITGTVEFGSLDSLGNATLAVFDVATAQDLVGKQGQLDQISVEAAPGASPEQLAQDIAKALPSNLQVETGSAQAASDSEDSQEAIDAIRAFLLAFAGISLFVGAFVIFNTLSMTIAQRIRELATLRTLGASRMQILASLLLEGLIIGVIASALGVLLGLLLAKGLTSLFDALGLGLPDAPSVFETRTAVVSILLGVSVTVLSTITPALRATRVPPIAAVREGSILPRSAISQRRLPIAAFLGLVGAALFVFGVLGDGEVESKLMFAGLTALALFIAVVLVGPAIARPLAHTIGVPFRRSGVAGDLGVHNAGRNPARTARTASALMIGLTLVTLVAALGSGLRGATRGALESQITADYVVEGSGETDTVPVAVERELDRSGFASAVVGIRSDMAEVLGDELEITAVNQLEVTEAYRFYGSAQDELPGALLIGGAVVDRDFAAENGLDIGSSLEIKTPTGDREIFTVRAFEDAPAISKLDPILGKVTISEKDFDRTFARPSNKLVLVNISGKGESALSATDGGALNQFAGLEILPREEWIDERVSGVNQLLNLLYVLLGLSVIVSLFGMLNALALAVFERTREIGMLRAVGLERRQLRRMIRDESIIIALIGGLTGMGLGLVLAAIVAEALSDEGVTFSVPFGTLVAFAVVAVLAGVIASILPARRAGRLDVLTALQYE